MWKACLSVGLVAVALVLGFWAGPAWKNKHALPPGITPRSVGGGSTPAPAIPGKRIALLVGINEYTHRDLPTLKYAERDAHEMDTVLRSLGYEVIKLVGKDATKDGIEKAVEKQARRPDKLDVFLFAFAGHGLQFTGGEAYLCPCDARPFKAAANSLVSFGWLNQQLETSFAQNRVLFVDACRNDPDPTRGRGVNDLPSLKVSPGTAALFSCAPGQRAFEDDKLQHGVFFHCLLESLRGKAANEEGIVTFNRLADSVFSLMKKQNVEQKPQQQVSSGNLVLAVMPGRTLPVEMPLAVMPSRTLPVEKLPPASGLVQNPDGTFSIPLPPPPAFRSDDVVTPAVAVAKHIDVDLGRGVKMKMVRIEPGKFMMGSPVGEKREPAEPAETQHEVELTKRFYMGIYTVTQEEYETVMGKNPSPCSAQGNSKDRVVGMDTRRFPVDNVAWKDAKEFCRRLSAKDGRTYRLPSEAEWEYACRAGTMTPYHTGANLRDQNLRDQANYTGGVCLPMNVGSFAANAWGLHDMHGNVNQWCEDLHDKDYYNNSPKTNPLNATTGTNRVFRGGAWNMQAIDCLASYRHSAAPDALQFYVIGFRVVSSAP